MNDEPAKEFRLWLGRFGELRNEVEAFLGYLEATRQGKASLVLKSESQEGFDWVADPSPKVFQAQRGGLLTIYTSGTTGTPKATTRQVAPLLGQKRGQGTAEDRWLLTYHPFRWAGLSLILHTLRWDSKLVVPVSLEIADIVAAMPDATHVSLTPSLFRKILLFLPEDRLRSLKFRQVTFGGEAATQPVLNFARFFWPEARITHTYASTELGDLCSVSDGIEGFPRAKLEGPRFMFDEQGQLHVGDQPSGDVWKLDGDRYRFVGRIEEVVNIGGAKVFLESVESAALTVEGVKQARARAVPNALLGQVITLDYVGSVEPMELRKALRARLPKVACPASVSRVDEIALSRAGKVMRR